MHDVGLQLRRFMDVTNRIIWVWRVIRSPSEIFMTIIRPQISITEERIRIVNTENTASLAIGGLTDINDNAVGTRTKILFSELS